ncbi:hypothetical protein DFH11DRAFT_58021 [Phellopilus nigrolimitatus]|nr:hypothetical protein DFH11DRAFT_58021 [Phellopilus nigrolimitatus]
METRSSAFIGLPRLFPCGVLFPRPSSVSGRPYLSSLVSCAIGHCVRRLFAVLNVQLPLSPSFLSPSSLSAQRQHATLDAAHSAFPSFPCSRPGSFAYSRREVATSSFPHQLAPRSVSTETTNRRLKLSPMLSHYLPHPLRLRPATRTRPRETARLTEIHLPRRHRTRLFPPLHRVPMVEATVRAVHQVRARLALMARWDPPMATLPAHWR